MDATLPHEIDIDCMDATLPHEIDIDAAARLPIAAVAAQLIDLLSSPVVMDIARAPDTQTVRRWRDGSRAPTRDRERALRFALQLAMTIGHRESPPVVRAWFETHNRYLNDTPIATFAQPLDSIRHTLMTAARAFAGI